MRGTGRWWDEYLFERSCYFHLRRDIYAIFRVGLSGSRQHFVFFSDSCTCSVDGQWFRGVHNRLCRQFVQAGCCDKIFAAGHAGFTDFARHETVFMLGCSMCLHFFFGVDRCPKGLHHARFTDFARHVSVFMLDLHSYVFEVFEVVPAGEWHLCFDCGLFSKRCQLIFNTFNANSSFYRVGIAVIS